MKILFVQFANSMFLRHEECDGYWDAFYKKYDSFGYWRGKYVFEAPKWIAEIDYLLDKSQFEREICWCKHSTFEVDDKIKEYKPDYILFSLMDCNKEFIRDIVERNLSYTFIVGGYNRDYIIKLENTYTNVCAVDTIEDDAKILGVEYKMGTDYSLFKNDTVLPRLTLSYGCRNHCKFCIIPHGKVETVDKDIVIQQIQSFKDLKFKLIYLDDKTFGQAENYSLLKELTEIIKGYNKDFEGYVVQTTSGMLLNKLKEFEELDVKVAEIGMETYNNPILRAYNKPSNEHLVDKCIEACKNSSINLILNVVIGFPEETTETYERTVDLIDKSLLNGVFGINPAIYTDYDNEDNQGEIDFQKSDKIELHRKYWDMINNLAKNRLNNG